MIEQVYAVRTAENFTVQSEAAFDWLEARTDVDTATDWLAGLQKAKSSLATLPRRCTTAFENKVYLKTKSI